MMGQVTAAQPVLVANPDGEPRRCGDIRILFVEDEESFRLALAETLRDDGHVVDAYGRPSEVRPAAIRGADIVITDYRMGLCELDGLAFADAVHAGRGDVPIVLLTAFDSAMLERRVAARDGFVVLRQKPIDYEVVHALVHRLVPAHALG